MSCNPSSGAVLCRWNTVKAGLVATPVPDKGDRLIACFDLTYYRATFRQKHGRKGERSRRTQDQHRLRAQGRGFEPRSGQKFLRLFQVSVTSVKAVKSTMDAYFDLGWIATL